MATKGRHFSLRKKVRAPRTLRRADIYNRQVHEAINRVLSDPYHPAVGPTVQEVVDHHIMSVMEACGYNRSMAADILGEHRRSLQRQLPHVERRIGRKFPSPGLTNIDIGAVIELRKRDVSWREIVVLLGVEQTVDALRNAVRRSLESKVGHGLPAKAWNELNRIVKRDKPNFAVFCRQLGLSQYIVRRELELAEERANLLRQDPSQRQQRGGRGKRA